MFWSSGRSAGRPDLPPIPGYGNAARRTEGILTVRSSVSPPYNWLDSSRSPVVDSTRSDDAMATIAVCFCHRRRRRCFLPPPRRRLLPSWRKLVPCRYIYSCWRGDQIGDIGETTPKDSSNNRSDERRCLSSPPPSPPPRASIQSFSSAQLQPAAGSYSSYFICPPPPLLFSKSNAAAVDSRPARSSFPPPLPSPVHNASLIFVTSQIPSVGRSVGRS